MESGEAPAQGGTASDAANVSPGDDPSRSIPVARPKQLWLVGAVVLLSVAVALRDGGRYLAHWGFGPQSAAYQVLALALLVTLFLCLRGLVLLKPRMLRVLVGLFLATAGWNASLLVLNLLAHGVLQLSVLAVLIVPPAIAAWYLRRPAFVRLAERYDRERQRQAMDRDVRRRLRRP